MGTKEATKFSVIIPVYNRAAFVGRAIKSVATQDCVDRSLMEILVIDDGSTDDSIKASRESNVGPSELVIIESNHTGQPGTTRNIGLRKARGEYIAYCDSDDYWLPHHLATALQAFTKDPELGMVSNFWALAHFVLLDNGAIQDTIIVPPHPPNTVNTNCRVHRRSCLRLGYFGTSRWGEDFDFFKRIEDNFKVTKTGTVTSVNGYIKGGNNLTYASDEGLRREYF